MEQESSVGEEAGPVPEGDGNEGGVADLEVGAESGSSQRPGIVSRELSEVERERLAVVQQLLSESEGTTVGQRQQLAAMRLGISVRSVQRLVARWKQEGLEGLLRPERRDQGVHRIEEEWQKYILKTYRQGNREGRRMSPAQVAVRVKARALELGYSKYPSHMTVYRMVAAEIEKRSRQVRSIGWRGDRLALTTRNGVRIEIEYSNQVWQADHTPVDVLVVDAAGDLLGRPWLTTVIDSYSRCLMGFYLGLEKPSSETVCLALRQAILPKRYSATYNLSEEWGTYGLPRYLYTDGGAEFRSKHIEAVAAALKIDAYLRRRPCDGGIVERPFGTFNSELWSSLPGYTGSGTHARPVEAESGACLTLAQLERLFVRYIVERYNQGLDARMGDQTRLGRWEAGRIAQLPLLGERDLDVCLMRREKRTVYRGGHLQFAGLVYRGEYLGGYAGQSVTVRYNPRDITTVLVYRVEGGKEVFLTRAHAADLETEELPLAEARAIGRRLRAAGRELSNRSVLSEVRSRDAEVAASKKRKGGARPRSAQSSVGGRPEQMLAAQTSASDTVGALSKLEVEPMQLPAQESSVQGPAVPLGGPEEFAAANEVEASRRRREAARQLNSYDLEERRQADGWGPR